MDPIIATLLIFLAITIVVLSIVIPVSVVNRKYNNFVLEHSTALKTLKEINSHYKFIDVPPQTLVHRYDNRNYYDTISPKDFLVYQLVFTQKTVLEKLNDAESNRTKFEKYKKEITERCKLNRFDTDQLLDNLERLKKKEKKLFERFMKTPRIDLYITVRLILTKINDDYITSKQQLFNGGTIRSLIGRINNKRGGRYQDREIWDAITRVERGRVSNKLRFKVYERDGNRCVKCGRRTNLEVDHIIPIAKGGKTTLSNLQTLCHRCNVEKGSNIEY